jgi:hypothetical protein
VFALLAHAQTHTHTCTESLHDIIVHPYFLKLFQMPQRTIEQQFSTSGLYISFASTVFAKGERGIRMFVVDRDVCGVLVLLNAHLP